MFESLISQFAKSNWIIQILIIIGALWVLSWIIIIVTIIFVVIMHAIHPTS
jgi:hypothetical protein